MNKAKLRGEMVVRRTQSDGFGVGSITGSGCAHYRPVHIDDVSDEMRLIVRASLTKEWLWEPEDTPATREAMRTYVGTGIAEDGALRVLVCDDPHCYPANAPWGWIVFNEPLAYGVVVNPDGGDGPIRRVAIAGPRAYCRKVCYRMTPHFFDLEVWNEGIADRYQAVLRCVVCRHGYDLVTPQSPSRWRRLRADPVARHLLGKVRP